MHPENRAPKSPFGEVLKFSCDHCQTELAIPTTLAGVSGPCPACGETISAPVATDEPAERSPDAVVAPEPPTGFLAAASSTSQVPVPSSLPKNAPSTVAAAISLQKDGAEKQPVIEVSATAASPASPAVPATTAPKSSSEKAESADNSVATETNESAAAEGPAAIRVKRRLPPKEGQKPAVRHGPPRPMGSAPAPQPAEPVKKPQAAAPKPPTPPAPPSPPITPRAPQQVSSPAGSAPPPIPASVAPFPPAPGAQSSPVAVASGPSSIPASPGPISPAAFPPPPPVPSSSNSSYGPPRVGALPPPLPPEQPEEQSAPAPMFIIHRTTAAPQRRRGIRASTKVAAAAVLLIGGYHLAAIKGYVPKWEELGQTIANWGKPVPPSQLQGPRIVSEPWNYALNYNPADWKVIHPGGNNRIFTLVSLDDPNCQVVATATAVCNANLENSSDDQDMASEFFRRVGAYSLASEGIKPEHKHIAGIDYLYHIVDEKEGTDYFRTKPVTRCDFVGMASNVLINYQFTATGPEAAELLPEIARSLLEGYEPLLEDASVTGRSRTSVSDPALLMAETGVKLYRPAPEWKPLPDPENQLLAMAKLVLGTKASALASESAKKKSPLPSTGYRTSNGDFLAVSVVHLPEKYAVPFPTLADWIVPAWLESTTVDRQKESPCTQGTAEGMEFRGTVTRDQPETFVLRVLREQDRVIFLLAASPKNILDADTLASYLAASEINQPSIDTMALNPGYTPAACRDTERLLIQNLGQLKESAGAHAEAKTLYEYYFSLRRDPHTLLHLCKNLKLLGQAELAVQTLKNHWRQIDVDPRFLAESAIFLAETNEVELAGHMIVLALQRGGIEFGYFSTSLVQGYLSTLRDIKASEASLTVLDVLNRYAPDYVWKLWEADILYNSPETKKRAIEILEGLVVSARKSQSLGMQIVGFLRERKAWHMGLDTANRLLSYEARNPLAWLLKATAEKELGRHSAADATLKQAQEYIPDLSNLDDFVYLLTDESGGPITSTTGPQLPPVPLPPEINRLMRAAVAEKKSAPATSHYDYLYRVHSITADPGSPGRYTQRIAVRIHSVEGMEMFNILKFPFAPHGVRLQINELRVRNAAGASIAGLDLSQSFVSDDKSDGMHTGMRCFNLPVAGLTAGCTLEYVLTEESLGLRYGALTTRHVFGAEAPSALEVFYIHSPVTRIDFAHSRGGKPTKIETGLFWHEKDCPAIVSEPFQPPLEQMAAVLWTGDSKESWARIGADYLNLIRHKLKPHESIKKLALEKTRHCVNDREKIAVLSAFVRENLSYAAIEFGMRALVPNTAAESMKNRYGDCKDHSTLLYELLRAVGIEARLALVNANTSVMPELPSMGAFNHMITAVPSQVRGKWDFIDCTNKYMAPQTGVPPWMLAGKYALVLGEGPNDLSPDCSKLVKIPAWPADFEKIVVQRDLTVKDNQHLAVNESITFHGTAACYLRYRLSAGGEKRDIPSTVRQMLGIDRTRHVVQSIRAENLSNLDQPLVISLEYDLRNACSRQGDLFTIHAPTLAEIRFMDSDDQGHQRLTPFYFETQLVLNSETTFTLPPGYSLAPYAGTPQGESDFGRWTLQQFSAEGRGRVKFQFKRSAGSFKPAQYQKFQAFVADATHNLEEIRFLPSKKLENPVADSVP